MATLSLPQLDIQGESQLLIDDAQRMILDAVGDGVCIVDLNRRILFWNRAAECITGRGEDEVLGKSCANGVLEHINEKGLSLCVNSCPLLCVMRDGQPHDVHMYMRHARGHRIPVHVKAGTIEDEFGNIVGSVGVFSVDTQRLLPVQHIEALEQITLVDKLTGLGNRRFFDRQIASSMANHNQHGTPFGILRLDVDQFTQFNDLYGEQTGDQILRTVADTISYNCRASDTPVRWHDDDFAIICDQISLEDLRGAAARMRMLIEHTRIEHAGRELGVTVSIGGCMTEPGDDVHAMLRRVDALVDDGKIAGRNCVRV